MEKREETNRKRWLKFYNFDYTDRRNYDYVIRTDDIDQEEIVKDIIKKLKNDNMFYTHQHNNL